MFLEDAEAGLIENVKKHIESNVNVKAMDGERRTALHRASLEGHPVIVKMILDALQKLGNQTATVSFNLPLFIKYVPLVPSRFCDGCKPLMNPIFI